MGFTVYGNEDSPVVPVLFYDPTLMLRIMNKLIDQGVAAVVVGFPAVPLTAARIRFCISASHTRADLGIVLRSISKVGDDMGLKFNHANRDESETDDITP